MMNDPIDTPKPKRNVLSLANMVTLAAWLKAQGDLTTTPVHNVAYNTSQAMHITVTESNVRTTAAAHNIPLYKRRKPGLEESAPIQIIKEQLSLLANEIILLQMETFPRDPEYMNPRLLALGEEFKPGPKDSLLEPARTPT